jgi:hypothetical protein
MSDETLDAVGPGHGLERLEQEASQPAALVFVYDRQGELGSIRLARHPDVPGHPHDGLARLVESQGNPGEMIGVVDLGQVGQSGLAQPVLGREEAPALGLRRQPGHAGGQPGLVVRADGP